MYLFIYVDFCNFVHNVFVTLDVWPTKWRFFGFQSISEI